MNCSTRDVILRAHRLAGPVGPRRTIMAIIEQGVISSCFDHVLPKSGGPGVRGMLKTSLYRSARARANSKLVEETPQ